jgi:hypothetical protein
MLVLRHRYANRLSSAGHLGLLLVGLHVGTRAGWMVVLGTITLLSLAFWAMNYRRARVVGDTPTSRAASAPQGYVELAGKGMPFPNHALVCPVSQTRCIWYRYIIEEKRDKNWKVVADRTSDDSFLLDDGTGEVLIDADGAEVITTRRRTWTEDRTRYTEYLLVPNEPLYAIGEFATVGGNNSQLDAAADLNDLLTQWKADKPKLHERFDLNRDGDIDPREWQLARQAARREVEKRHREIRSQPGVHTLRRPRDGRHFLVSNLHPDELARRYARWTMFQMGLAIAAGSALVALVWVNG